MRHIIVLTPDMSITQQEADLSQELTMVSHTLSKKTDASKDLIVKRIEAFEKNQRTMLKGQQAVMNKVKQILMDQQMEAQKKKKEEEEKAEKAPVDKDEEED